MSEERKTWIVEPGDVLEVMSPTRKQPVTVRTNNIYEEPLATASRTPRAVAAEPARRRARPEPPARSPLQFAPLTALTYLLGPLAVVITPRGRRRRSLLALAGVAVGATLILALFGFGRIVQVDRPWTAWLWIGLATTAVVGGFTAWARAIQIVGREGIPHVNKMPHWLRRSGVISTLGLVAPGSGLLIAGRAGQAGLSLWLLWPAVLAAVILANALGLWRHHLDGAWLANSGPALETMFLAAAAVLAVGFLGYIAQALEGVRQVLVEPGLKTRVKGDYYAVAVVAAVVVFVVAANPARMAHQIGLGGEVLREEGLQLIPLQMSLASARLDPSRPEYVMQAVELYEQMGEREQAASLRAELNRNLGSYVALVQRETVSEFGLAQAGAARNTAARAKINHATPIAPQAPANRADPAGGVDPAQLMGTAAGQKAADATPDSATEPQPVRATSGLGMPFGIVLPIGEAGSQAD